MAESTVVTEADVAAGAARLGIADRAVCVHASLRSFPRLESGPATLVDGLVDAGATVLVGTMANEAFAIPPPLDDRPERNGIDYVEQDRQAAVSTWPGLTDIYVHTRTEVSSWLGATSAYVAARPDRLRCRLSPDFAAVGPLAQQLIEAEVEEDVFGPLRALAFCNGWVLLVGVSLTRLTLLHLAETMAGRRPFVRWLRGPDGMPRRVRVGECSEGFDRLAQVLAPVEHRIMVGDSLWRAFPASEALELAAVAIRAQPEITHCAEPGCIACADAITSGPVDP
jgi:aminoglycoside 3-N-acetyltransferase